MRNKMKITAKEEQAWPALVPKLRFPEFRKAALRSVLLGDVTEEGRARNGHKHLVTSVMGVTKADGIVPMEARLIAADIARYKLVQHDWFAYNPMRLNIGSIARWRGQNEILVSPDYVVFKCLTESESGIAPGFLDHFRQTKTWEEFVTEGGDGSVRIRIYYKDIARVALVLPPFPEQQKIAECLSSVDELLAAQARKVDALKTHKKGLMQQLFPREGETQPRFRFPEFQNAGEWKPQRLSGLIDLISGMHLSPDDYSTVGEVPYFTGPSDFANDRSKVTKWTKRTANVSQAEDTLITVKGSGVGEIWYTTLPEVAMGRQLMAVHSKNGSSRFMFQFLLTKRSRFEDLGSGNLIPGLSRAVILELEACFPSPAEQQRIATCLTTLDALITAEIQKHEALKIHKKGLMQQLFPSSEEYEP